MGWLANMKMAGRICAYEPCRQYTPNKKVTGALWFCCKTHEKKDGGQAAAWKEHKKELARAEAAGEIHVLNLDLDLSGKDG